MALVNAALIAATMFAGCVPDKSSSIGRTLAEWGHAVGASERTLARAFLADTGVSFGRWRTMLRVQAALGALAGGEPVGNVARHVGYDSDSAFVQALNTADGQKRLNDLARKNGRDLDGTPIITSASHHSDTDHSSTTNAVASTSMVAFATPASTDHRR